jgi:hypothetical protein
MPGQFLKGSFCGSIGKAEKEGCVCLWDGSHDYPWGATGPLPMLFSMQKMVCILYLMVLSLICGF